MPLLARQALAQRLRASLAGASLLSRVSVSPADLGSWANVVVVRSVGRIWPHTLLVTVAPRPGVVALTSRLALAPTGEVVAAGGVGSPTSSITLCTRGGCEPHAGQEVGAVAAASVRWLAAGHVRATVVDGGRGVLVEFGQGARCELGPSVAAVAGELGLCRAVVGRHSTALALGADVVALEPAD